HQRISSRGLTTPKLKLIASATRVRNHRSRGSLQLRNRDTTGVHKLERSRTELIHRHVRKQSTRGRGRRNLAADASRHKKKQEGPMPKSHKCSSFSRSKEIGRAH